MLHLLRLHGGDIVGENRGETDHVCANSPNGIFEIKPVDPGVTAVMTPRKNGTGQKGTKGKSVCTR